MEYKAEISYDIVILLPLPRAVHSWTIQGDENKMGALIRSLSIVYNKQNVKAEHWRRGETPLNK